MTGRILIVDDDPGVLDSVSKTLSAHGFDTDTARDGLRAVLLASTQKPDLILLDVNLPRLNGIEALKRIKSDGMAGPKVVMMTAVADKDTIVQAVYAGANDYLAKPFEPEALVGKIEKHLGRVPADGNPDAAPTEAHPARRRKETGLAALAARALRDKPAEE
ncbi:MAG: hypothetical protein A3G34_06065 [Candidatus Lindowbacteria bacterium RIFCSPLOWO2_12_FULL_62_27]|nr:MAG: hypothetical protein A3G34_06065 [Candidatus Lindowbacteria bacterium RIFCSPLOWO2_12_FULL_62_27]OGH57461.1 MAG: hypothetical protein A3I06_06425 [Candidatus Lindowbacteria bacterium RIFCSPLOWO2_02_FULL_62_12]